MIFHKRVVGSHDCVGGSHDCVGFSRVLVISLGVSRDLMRDSFGFLTILWGLSGFPDLAQLVTFRRWQCVHRVRRARRFHRPKLRDFKKSDVDKREAEEDRKVATLEEGVLGKAQCPQGQNQKGQL